MLVYTVKWPVTVGLDMQTLFAVETYCDLHCLVCAIRNYMYMVAGRHVDCESCVLLVSNIIGSSCLHGPETLYSGN